MTVAVCSVWGTSKFGGCCRISRDGSAWPRSRTKTTTDISASRCMCLSVCMKVPSSPASVPILAVKGIKPASQGTKPAAQPQLAEGDDDVMEGGTEAEASDLSVPKITTPSAAVWHHI